MTEGPLLDIYVKPTQAIAALHQLSQVKGRVDTICREAVAAGTIIVAKQGTENNLADLFTK
eukprot:5543486-Ditylum_brightwellii.AAC.1